MGKIQVLSDVLASQVAAGEVVERPASVVKELIENSLDAGATQIAVLARRGGTALLRIVDNGVGMHRDDALMSLERHATSKLRTSADLATILTKGFRGEALPSIASVSKFTLATREHAALTGTRVTVEGGTILEVSDDGDAPGTSIEVRQLFYNVPARRKFLRAEDTEFSHIEQQVRVQALAHPEVGFSLTRDDRLLFHLPPGESLLGRISGLTGQDLADRLLPVPRTTCGPITVSGYLGEAGLWRSNRALQFTFLNRRPVESIAFSQALRAGYGEALPRGQSPVTFLLIEIDPSEVDVNVHPAKREVRFRSSLAVQSALTEIIAATLRAGRPSLSPPPRPSPGLAPTTPVPRWTPPVIQPALIPAHETRALRHDWADQLRPVEASPEAPPSPEQPRPEAGLLQTPASAPAPALPAPPATAPAFRPIGLLGTAYLILESAEGLVLLDHRAAWERILYEESKARSATQPVASQALLSPLTIALSPREFDFLKPQLPALRRLGLGLEEFGQNTVLIDSLPTFLRADGEIPALLSALLDDLRHASDRTPQRQLGDAAIAAAVARQSARRQPPSTMENASALVTRLMSCEMPYCRPDGSPTILQFSWQELARKFGRA
ncbi:MAG: DNA mismatch repair endonuclease MutL [Verrucomicrobiota bacterium]